MEITGGYISPDGAGEIHGTHKNVPFDAWFYGRTGLHVTIHVEKDNANLARSIAEQVLNHAERPQDSLVRVSSGGGMHRGKLYFTHIYDLD
jgi:hypothetical protein